MSPSCCRVERMFERLAVVDPASEESALVERIAELERVKSAAAAGQARAAAALDAARRAAEAAAGVPAVRRGRGAASEVALARRDSPSRGNRHLGFAKALVHEMPHTLAALEVGVLTEWRATLIVRESACLDVEDRRALDAELCGDPAGIDGNGRRQRPGGHDRRRLSRVGHARRQRRSSPNTRRFRVRQVLPGRAQEAVHADAKGKLTPGTRAQLDRRRARRVGAQVRQGQRLRRWRLHRCPRQPAAAVRDPEGPLAARERRWAPPATVSRCPARSPRPKARGFLFVALAAGLFGLATRRSGRAVGDRTGRRDHRSVDGRPGTAGLRRAVAQMTGVSAQDTRPATRKAWWSPCRPLPTSTNG